MAGAAGVGVPQAAALGVQEREVAGGVEGQADLARVEDVAGPQDGTGVELDGVVELPAGFRERRTDSEGLKA